MNIQDYVKEEVITFDLHAKTKLEAIQELTSLLYTSQKIDDKEKFIEAVLEREEEFTTGVGEGVAIPHGKSEVVKRACIAYGKSKEGIEWNSLDDKLVHTIFLLAIPEEEDENHLEMLSLLARRLMHVEVKQALKAADDIESFYKAIG